MKKEIRWIGLVGAVLQFMSLSVILVLTLTSDHKGSVSARLLGSLPVIGLALAGAISGTGW